MAEPEGLQITYAPIGRGSTAVLTVKLGGETLDVEKVDVGKQQARDKFVERICKGRSGIRRDLLDNE